jgi:hypothetical protein
MQDIMRIVNEGILDRKEEIDNTWKVRRDDIVDYNM